MLDWPVKKEVKKRNLLDPLYDLKSYNIVLIFYLRSVCATTNHNIMTLDG